MMFEIRNEELHKVTGAFAIPGAVVVRCCGISRL